MKTPVSSQMALKLFKEHGGLLRTQEALDAGISPKTLYSLRDQKLIVPVTRGLYQLATECTLSYYDLTTVAKRLPNGVICLISALDFHGLTTQIPKRVEVAYQPGWWTPKVDYPPVRIVRYSKKHFSEGLEIHILDGIEVPIYSAARTVVDCFKHRNRYVGLDVAIEALKDYWQQQKGTLDELMRLAELCRMKNVIRPYVEAIIHE